MPPPCASRDARDLPASGASRAELARARTVMREADAEFDASGAGFDVFRDCEDPEDYADALLDARLEVMRKALAKAGIDPETVGEDEYDDAVRETDSLRADIDLGGITVARRAANELYSRAQPATVAPSLPPPYSTRRHSVPHRGRTRAARPGIGRRRGSRRATAQSSGGGDDPPGEAEPRTGLAANSLLGAPFTFAGWSG